MPSTIMECAREPKSKIDFVADGIDMALRFLDLIFCIFQICQMKINYNDY